MSDAEVIRRILAGEEALFSVLADVQAKTVARAQIRIDGSFEFENVDPGHYTVGLIIHPESFRTDEDFMRNLDKFRFALCPVDVEEGKDAQIQMLGH